MSSTDIESRLPVFTGGLQGDSERSDAHGNIRHLYLKPVIVRIRNWISV